MSITLSGVLVAVGGTLLLKLGFSEVCSNELIQLAPVLVGGALSWYGRVRAGGVKWYGARA